MSAGSLIQAYAYEVAPQQASSFRGGKISISNPLQNALNLTFSRSRIDSAPAVTFQVDQQSPSRAHPIRDAALTVAFSSGAEVPAVEGLARRLADAMDHRSKSSLLIVSVHQSAQTQSRRLLIWTFPQEEVFNFQLQGGQPSLELLDAFNRESKLRKAALLEGPNEKTGMLTARVLDFQATGSDSGIADLWIHKFLNARMQMNDVEGTQLLARALRNAHNKTKGDVDAQEQINSAISGIRANSGQRWSMESVAQKYLSDTVETAFLSGIDHESRAAIFGLDLARFDTLIHYKRFTLANGIIVSAPFIALENNGALSISATGSTRVLRAEGIIEEEEVRVRG